VITPEVSLDSADVDVPDRKLEIEFVLVKCAASIPLRGRPASHSSRDPVLW